MSRTLGLLAVSLALPACHAGSAPNAPAVVTPEIRVTAADFAFTDGADTVTSGNYTVRLVNTGRAPHMMVITRIDSAHTLPDLLHAIASNQETQWAVELGGPQVTMPGDSTAVEMTLAAGHYAAICWVPDSAGRPHEALGMIRALEVVPATGPVAAEPVMDDTLNLNSFSIVPSHPLRAGTHVVRVDNVDNVATSHDLLLIRLRPGHTVDQAMGWLDSQVGPLTSFDVVGGTGGMAGGQHVGVPLILSPGSYALLCIMPDGHGKSHYRHGMVTAFTVE